MIPILRKTPSSKKLQHFSNDLLLNNWPIFFKKKPVRPSGPEALSLLIEKTACLISDIEMGFVKSRFILSVTRGWKLCSKSLTWIREEYLKRSVKYWTATSPFSFYAKCSTPKSSSRRGKAFFSLAAFTEAWKHFVFLSPSKTHLSLLFCLQKISSSLKAIKFSLDHMYSSETRR